MDRQIWWYTQGFDFYWCLCDGHQCDYDIICLAGQHWSTHVNIKLYKTTFFALHAIYNSKFPLISKPVQHTSWGSCFTAGKFSCLTWADQSPLSHSVLQGPSLSLASETISVILNIQKSSVTSAGRLADLVSSFRTESVDILNHYKTTSDIQLQNTPKQHWH